MKQLRLFIFALTLIPLKIIAQAPGCPNVDAGPDQQINCVGTANLLATPLHTGLTNTYVVSSIPYAPPFPFNAGNPILVNIDDRWSNIIQLPFNFCYYGNTYNQIVVGSNGVISFNTTYAGGTCPWSFSVSVPSPSLPLNSIFGPYHDIDPAVSGSMFQSVIGSYPCRTFVVNYFQIPMYSGSCNLMLATHQIVLYESTNVIEVYMQNKPLCSSWNNGNAVVGIQNSTGTVGIAAPGRNTGQWTATNEAWRFTPNGNPNYSISWWQGGNLLANGNTVTVSPLQTTTYTAVCVYSNCDGTDVTVQDNVTVEILNPLNVTITPTSDTICQFDSTTISIQGAYFYQWSPTSFMNIINDSTVRVAPPISMVYTVNYSDQDTSCTGSMTIPITVIPKPTVGIVAIPTTICEGDTTELHVFGADSIAWDIGSNANPRIETPAITTTYNLTGYDLFGCSNTASVTVNVSPLPNITFNPPNPGVCLGDEAIITASGAQFYIWSNNTFSNPFIIKPDSTTTYSVTGTDASGLCTSTAEVIVTVLDAPTTNFSALLKQGCIPLSIQFADSSLNAVSWFWNFGNNQTSTSQNPNHSFQDEGTYTVTLITTSPSGCKDTMTIIDLIQAYPQPIGDFTFTPEWGKIYNPNITFYSNSISQYWLWDWGDNTFSTSEPPILHNFPSIEGAYQVTLTLSNDYGCIDSITKTILIIDDLLELPNIITPNNDGWNDFLIIKNADKYPNNVLTIFNRWGKIVFKQTNYDNSFDGGNLSDGVYYYTFQYLDRIHTSSLTIIR